MAVVEIKLDGVVARGGGGAERMRNLLTGLDVGTSKVCALVGEAGAEGELAVLGHGVAPCTGLRKGVVVNIEATVEAIRAALAYRRDPALPSRPTTFGRAAASRWQPNMGGGRLPVVNGKRVVRAFCKAGFGVERIVGSHHLRIQPDDLTRTATAPVHSNRDLKPGTLRSIIRQTGLTVEEFTKLA